MTRSLLLALAAASLAAASLAGCATAPAASGPVQIATVVRVRPIVAANGPAISDSLVLAPLPTPTPPIVVAPAPSAPTPAAPARDAAARARRPASTAPVATAPPPPAPVASSAPPVVAVLVPVIADAVRSGEVQRGLSYTLKRAVDGAQLEVAQPNGTPLAPGTRVRITAQERVTLVPF